MFRIFIFTETILGCGSGAQTVFRSWFSYCKLLNKDARHLESYMYAIEYVFFNVLTSQPNTMYVPFWWLVLKLCLEMKHAHFVCLVGGMNRVATTPTQNDSSSKFPLQQNMCESCDPKTKNPKEITCGVLNGRIEMITQRSALYTLLWPKCISLSLLVSYTKSIVACLCAIKSHTLVVCQWCDLVWSIFIGSSK